MDRNMWKNLATLPQTSKICQVFYYAAIPTFSVFFRFFRLPTLSYRLLVFSILKLNHKREKY